MPTCERIPALRPAMIGILLLSLAAPLDAGAQIKVIPVPYRPHDLTIPQMAYPGHPTRFKAIARDVPATAGNQCAGKPYFRWDINGDGVHDAIDACDNRSRVANVGDGTWYQNDRYNLDCLKDLPAVSADIKRKLFMATIEVACNFNNGVPTDSSVGTYRVMLFNDVPRGRSYSDANRYGWTARPDKDQHGNAIPATCTASKCAVTNFPCPSGLDADCAGDSDFSLKIKREVALGDALWYLHNAMLSRSGSGKTMTASMPFDGGATTQDAAHNVSVGAAFLWSLNQNGHNPAYPSPSSSNENYEHGTASDSKPLPDSWNRDNDTRYNTDPYAEDALRMMNYVLGSLAAAGYKPDATSEANDLRAAIPDTDLRSGLYYGTSYSMGHIIPALSTTGMAGTTAQVGSVKGRSIEWVVQELVDAGCHYQIRGEEEGVHQDGTWHYTYRSGFDGSTTQWMFIGLEAADKAMGNLDPPVIVNKHCKYSIANGIYSQTGYGYAAGTTAGTHHNGAGRYSTGATFEDVHLAGGLLVGHGWLGVSSMESMAGYDRTHKSFTPASDVTDGALVDRFNASLAYVGNRWYYDGGGDGDWLNGAYEYGPWWEESAYGYRDARFDGKGRGDAYVIFSIQKGLRTLDPLRPTVTYNSGGVAYTIDWFRDYSYYWINNQKKDGSAPQTWGSEASIASISYERCGTSLLTAWGEGLVLTEALFEPDPVASGTASIMRTDEGCQNTSYGKITFQHQDSYHMDPKRKIQEYQWLFQTVESPTNETFAAIPWNNLALDEPDLEYKSYHTTDEFAAVVWQYLHAGNYHAALRVKDNSPTPKYNIYSIKNITVAPQPDLAPTANAHGPYEVIEGNDLVLEGAASDPNLLCRADGLTSTWYLPATVPRPGVGLAGPAPWLGVLDQIPTRNTPVPIKLVVSDSQAATADATSETTVTIWDRDFHPCFDLTPSTTVGCNGTVHVDASCTYPHPHTGTGFRTFEWQCNNPLPLEAAGFAFTAQAVGLASDCTYTTEGSYYLTLKVTDNYGTVQYVQQQVTMSSSSAPRANAGPGYTLETWLVNEWDAETLRQGGSITLDGSGSSDPDAACGDSITKYEWDLNGDWIADDLNGDGVVTDLDRVARPTLTWANLYKLLPPAWDKTKYLANPRTGLPNLPVNLTVTDEHGKTARASSSLTIYHSGPYARYTANPNPASCGEGAPPVTFDGSTSWHGHPAKTIAQWAWVFDMPEAVTGADPALILAKFAEHVDALGPRVTYNYPAFGVYHPVLRVTDGQGRMSLAYGATVVVSEGNAAPQVDIGGPYEFAVGGLLQLDARGTVDPNEGCGDDAVLYEWDLDGDGVFAEPSPEQGKAAEPVGEAPILQWSQVSHWIPASAWPAAPPDWGERWTVGLKVTDTRGASATATVEIPIYEQTPVAVADSAPKPFVPIDTATGKALVRLDGSWSYTSDPGLKILQWSWKLGAGTQTTTGETAQLQVDLNAERPIWSVAGGTVTKPITLRVTDSGNNIADDTIDVTFKVLASTPATIRFADDQLLIQQQDPLTVAASATPAPNLTVDYVGWDLDGNGSDDVVWNRGDPGTPEQALQLNRAWGDLPAALRALGAHEVRLTVTDSLGTVSQDAVKVTVLEHALRAAIVVTPPLGGCTTTFAFDASGSESLIESEIVRYSWNFGDGTTGTGLAANHAYGQFGTYTVTLTVEDDGVVTHTASATATVSTTNGNLPPVVEANGPYFLDSDRFSQDETLRLTLTGQGTTDPDSACGDTITRYRWDLDGLLDLQGNRTWEIDTAASEVSISWADVQRWNLPAGNVNRQIYLQAEDRHGGRSESWTTLQIGSGQPVARFRATPLTAMCGEPVSFDATESYHPVPSLSIKTLAWDFDYDGIFTPSALHVNEKIFRQVLPRVGKVIVRLRAGDENDTYNYFDVEINNSGDNAAPIPRAKPVLAAFGEVVVLDASLSMDPNEACGDQVSWFAWDLNDDGVIDSEGAGAIQTMSAAKFQSFGFAVQEPFDQTPVKIGKLYVQDMDEKPATTEVKIYYYQVTPHPVATVQPPKAGCQVEMVFDGSGSYHNHPARKITHYAWDLDTTVDSDKNGVANDDTDGVGVQFRYAGYREKKAYGAQLTVTDEYGKVASVAVSPSPEVSFENQKPIANPGGPYLTTIGNDGTIPVNLDGNGSSDPNEPCDAITEYAWDTDGDGCYGEEDELGVVTANKPLCGTAATAGSAMCGAEDCTGDVVNVASSTWRVGQTYVVGLIVKDRYGTWSDVAETMITVAESVPPTVTIVHPNGGEVWGKDPTAVNQTRAIELKLSHPKGKRARLKLSMNGEELVLANDLYDAPVTPQTYTIPFDTTLFANKTDFYRLKVLAELETDPAIFSTTLSQSPFSIDNAGPTITTTPATDMTLATAVEQLDAAGTEVAASAQVADQDPAPVVTYKLNGAAVAKIPSKFPLGRNVLEISAQDWLRPVPNKTVATRVIWVKDTRAPDLLPGPDVVMKARGVDGFTPVDFSPSAYDLCAGDLSSAITLSAAAGIDTIDGEELIYGFPVGTRTVQFEVLDGEGNPASATITVTIVDDEPPYFTQEPSDVAFPQTSPAGTLATGLVGSADWPQVLYRDDGYATAQLTCGLFVTLVDQDGDPVDPPAAGYSCTAPVFPAGAYFPIGVTTMTYVVEDPGGLSASTEVQLTVVGADPVAHLLTRPASDEWLNCAVDSCVLEFSVENVNPAWPVTVTPLPRAGDPQPLPEDGKYRLTYAADGVYLVRISMWDRADLEHIQQVPRFNIDTSGPTSTVTDFDQEGAVPGDPATWPLFFRGEEAAPRFAAQDGLSGIEQVKVTVVPGLLEGGAKTILDRPQSLSGTPPTGPKFLGNLSCTDEANVCRGGKLFLGGMQAGEQKLVVESKDGAGNLSTTEFPFRLIGLAEALVIVRTRIAGYLQADPEGAAVSLLQQIDGYLATGQRSLSRGYLGGTLVSIYDAVSIMRGAALRLVATDELEAELLEDARLLARGSYAETYLYWKLNAVGTSEEQTAYIALAQAWEFIWTDGQYDAAVLKISNAYFYARNGKFPFRATDVPSSIDVIHRIMAELQGYTQYRELPAVEEADELLHDLDALVLWRFENLQNPGWLPAKEFMELLLDLQDLANQMFMAQSKGCWVRNWQWGFAQAIRVVIDVAKADAEGHLPPGHAQYCKIQEAQVQYDLGMGYLDNREPDLMLDLYANWSKGIRCLMLEIYHHAGYLPVFPVEDWGCQLQGCGGAAEQD